MMILYCLVVLGQDEKFPVYPWHALVPYLRRPLVIHPSTSQNPLSSVLTGLPGMPSHAQSYGQILSAQTYPNPSQYESLSSSNASIRHSSHIVSPQYPINYHMQKYPLPSATRDAPSCATVSTAHPQLEVTRVLKIGRAHV